MAVLSRRRVLRWILGSAAGFIAALANRELVYAQGVRAFTVVATRGLFKVANSDKPEIRVNLGDLVRITFEAQDIPHSFTTIEVPAHYRIDRRAEPGKPVTFDFRADRVGEVPIQCALTIDPKCKDMRMTLVVVQPK